MVEKGQFLERMTLVSSGDPIGSIHLEGLYHRGDRGPSVLIVTSADARGGGSMDNPVAAEVAWAVTMQGHPTLRFNFRGVGASQGEISGPGEDEEDVDAALTHLVETDGFSVIVVGIAHGCTSVLDVARQDDRVEGIVLIGPPNTTDFDSAARCLVEDTGLSDRDLPVLVLIAQGEGIAAAVDYLLKSLGSGVRTEKIASKDNSFERGLSDVGRFAAAFVSSRPV